MIGTLGQRISKLSRNRRSGSLAGATIREWKACEVARATLLNPFSSKAAIAAFTGAVSPAMTVILGEFLLAAITYPSVDSKTAATSS